MATNLDSLIKSLHGWSRKHIGYLPKKLYGAQKRLFVLCKRNDQSAKLESKKIIREMDKLLLKEEIMWKQRPRMDKMKWGDHNTKFFHRKASWRAKKNNISALRKSDGSSRKT